MHRTNFETRSLFSLAGEQGSTKSKVIGCTAGVLLVAALVPVATNAIEDSIFGRAQNALDALLAPPEPNDQAYELPTMTPGEIIIDTEVRLLSPEEIENERHRAAEHAARARIENLRIEFNNEIHTTPLNAQATGVYTTVVEGYETNPPEGHDLHLRNLFRDWNNIVIDYVEVSTIQAIVEVNTSGITARARLPNASDFDLSADLPSTEDILARVEVTVPLNAPEIDSYQTDGTMDPNPSLGIVFRDRFDSAPLQEVAKEDLIRRVKDNVTYRVIVDGRLYDAAEQAAANGVRDFLSAIGIADTNITFEYTDPEVPEEPGSLVDEAEFYDFTVDEIAAN